MTGVYQEDVLTDIYAAASPAVVQIQVTAQLTGYFGGTAEGLGTGFLIDSDGYILTNNHVIEDATDLQVMLDDGTLIDAEVIGTDSIHDLALIKMDAADVAGITPLEFADSSHVVPGQMAVALGNPFGLNDTITVGIISGLDRTVTGSALGLYGMLQTDAAISPGNSGGPLLNSDGQVIGINTAVEADIQAENIGFAIPSNVATGVLSALKAGEEITRPWIGISGVALTESLAEELNLTVDQGVYVVSVVADSPAEAAGLVAAEKDQNGEVGSGGDVITAVDGQSVKSVTDLATYIQTMSVGDTVTLTIVRDGQTISVDVTLDAWPETTQVSRTIPTPSFDIPWGGGNSR